MRLNLHTIEKAAILTAWIVIACVMTGCGDFFAEKQTELESKAILEELGQVRESPHTANPLPEMYRQPTGRLSIKGGIKVFYFTKHHPAGDLALLVQQQTGLTSTVSLATNQVVVYCADDAQADMVQSYLELIDIAPVQVNVDCLILERFGDITMDWETTLLVENLLGEGVTLGEAKYPNPAFPGASLREAERGNFGLDFGYWVNKGVSGHQIRTVVDTLVSRGYLKILLNPQLETINGKKAEVTIKDYAPIEEVKTGSGGSSGVYNITTYVWVENTLAVTPQVYSDGSIGLTTDIKIGSRSKPEGVVQRSIITERSINVEENRIEPGKSMIIGGMRKSEKRSVVRGIPFLKDLPVIGMFFSSKDFEEKGTEIIFILTPSISSGGVENAKMVEEIRGKYDEPEFKKGLAGSLGKDVYTQVVEKEANEAELERIGAELDLEQAKIQAQAEKERADKASGRAEQLRQEAQQLQIKAQQAMEAAKHASEQVQKIKTQTQADQQKAQEIEQKKQQAIEAVQKSQQEFQQAAEKSLEAAQRAQEAGQQAEQARQQLEKAQKAAAEKEARAKARQEKLQRQAREKELQAPEPADPNKVEASPPPGQTP